MSSQEEYERKVKHLEYLDKLNYLEDLIRRKEYGIFAIEFVQGLIGSEWNGKGDIQEFLSVEKDKLIKNLNSKT